jgi:uncharacterized protein
MSSAPTFTLAAPAQTAIQPNKNFRIAEIGLVLLIALYPYLLRAIAVHLGLSPSLNEAEKSAGMANGVMHDLVAILLLSYVLHRQGKGFRDIGLRPSGADLGRSMLLAVGTYPVTMVSGIVLYLIYAFAGKGLPVYWNDPGSLFGQRLSLFPVLYLAISPFFEEILMRAYLMTEVMEISGRTWLAIVISVAVQSSIHIYQGWNNVFILSATFAVFALYFAKTRRATPVILAHYLMDIWSFGWYFTHHH